MKPKKILFVCLGNICRSPMAEFVFRHLAQQQGVADRFVVDSAATSDEEHGNPLYPPARQKLQQEGIACEGHRARQITRADYDRYDYIVGMNESNMRDLWRMLGGDPQHKLSMLLDHTPITDAAHHGRGVADPWYTRDFDTAYEDIYVGCQALLEELSDEMVMGD